MLEAVSQIAAALDADAVLTGADIAAHARGAWGPIQTPLALVRPRKTSEVAAIMRIAHGAGAAVVPWGGRTGLVDGTAAGGCIALSLERMNAIEEIDPQTATMRVEAGVIVQAACEAAEAQGLFLPIDLGARGSATIGGVISTNAGGNHVIRYGMMRDMVLGVEAVLADGETVDCLHPLIKNNTGYDLKQLFIGSEGTLGVVTRATLRLRPAPSSQEVALIGAGSFAKVVTLLRTLERDLGGALSAYEVMWPDFFGLVTSAPAKGVSPLSGEHAFYVLVEALGSHEQRDAALFAEALERALERGLLEDAVIAKSKAERTALWALRDDVMQVARNGPIVTFDVSLKIADMQAYVARVRGALRARWPGASLVVFGHLGDGNLHLIAGVGDRSADRAVEDIVYGALAGLDGSISAEHGIGLQKRAYLHLSRSPAEIALMRTIKAALDPKGILNPGKIFDVASGGRSSE
jgi:FAD/FMN-containing dehydrogenase